MSIRNPEVIQADRDQFGALALYVVQRPAKAKSVLELETGKACLWFRHFPFVFSSASRVGRRRARQIHWLDSSLRDVKQDDSNNEVAPSRSGEQIDDVLDGLVGAVVGGFKPAVWAMLRVRTVVEAAVGKWSAQPFVEEQK